MSKITFSQAMRGYLLTVGARHLSPHTIRDYANAFNKFTAFLGEDLPLEDITHKHIEGFFAAQTKVTNKTLLNYHTVYWLPISSARCYYMTRVDLVILWECSFHQHVCDL